MYSGRTRAVLTTAVVLVGTYACSDLVTSPNKLIDQASPPQLDLAPAAQHFFFQQPLAKAYTYTGTSDVGLSPKVVVCSVTNSSADPKACDQIVATFTTTSSTGAQVVRYDATAEQYIVNWQSDQCSWGPCTLDPTKRYRIRVLVGPQQLGFVEVALVTNGSQIKSSQSGDVYTMVDGRTLPIKFRIEKGAINVIPSGASFGVTSAGAEIASGDGNVGLSVPPGALSTSTGITIQPLSNPAPGGGNWSQAVDLGPTGTTFAQPVQLSLKFDATKLPAGVPASALRIYTQVEDGWAVVPNAVVNEVDGVVSAPISHFSNYTVLVAPNSVSSSTSATTVLVGDSTMLTARASYVGADGNSYPATNQWLQWQSFDSVAIQFAQTLSLTDASGTARATAFALQPSIILQSPENSLGARVCAQIRGMYAGDSSSCAFVRYTILGRLSVSPHSLTLPIGWAGSLLLLQSTATPSPLNISVKSVNKLTLADPRTGVHTDPGQVGNYTMDPGQRSMYVTISDSTRPGVDTVIASAPGYTADTAVVTIVQGTLLASGWPTSLARGDSAAFSLLVADQNGQSSGDLAYPISVGLDNSSGLAFSSGGLPLRTASIARRSSDVIWVKAVATGPQFVKFYHPWYSGLKLNLDVTAPRISAVLINPDSAVLNVGRSLQIAARALDYNGLPIPDPQVSWSTSDPTVALVDSTGVVRGIAIGTAIIRAAFSNGAFVSSFIRVGVPSIAVSNNSSFISVKPGQSQSASLQVLNSATGVLDSIALDTAQNQYNGARYSWIHQSIDRTTAPATITLTASPDSTVAPGQYDLTFSVRSPSAPNSPYSVRFSVRVESFYDAVISVPATTVWLTAPTGSVTTTTIPVTNSGAGVLTNLDVRQPQNENTGEKPGWLTAYYDTTTAPAHLTLRAAPPIGFSATTQRYSFTILGTAKNSPFDMVLTLTTTPGCALPSGMAGFWKLDEGTGTSTTDDTGIGSVATLHGSPTWTTGPFTGKSALRFADAGDYVDLGSVLQSSVNAFTVSAWVRPDGFSNRGDGPVGGSSGPRIISATDGDGWAIGHAPGDGRIQVELRNVTSFILPTTYPLNTWSNIAVTYDGSSVRTYLNGTLIDSRSAPGGFVHQASSCTFIGNEPEGCARQTNGNFAWQGGIDDVALYSRALSAAEIMALYSRCSAPTQDVQAVASVTVTPSPATIAPGASVQLTATARDASGNAVSGHTAVWSSSNSNVATVDANGLVHGSSSGTVTVTANVDDVAGSGSVTVSDWASENQLDRPLWGVTTITLNGDAYVIGGSSDLAAGSPPPHAVKFDHNTRTWSNIAPIPYEYSQWGVIRAIGTTYNGKLYVFGGWECSDCWDTSIYTYEYTPETNTWRKRASNTHPMTMGAAFTFNNVIYVFSGTDHSSGSRFDIYDPATDQWTALPVPPKHSFPGGAAFDNGKFYVAGGELGTDNAAVLDVYDPATNAWTRKASMPAYRSAGSGQFFQGKFYVFGGSKPSRDVFAYDPATDTWSIPTQTPTILSDFGSAIVNNQILLIGGFDDANHTVSSNVWRWLNGN